MTEKLTYFAAALVALVTCGNIRTALGGRSPPALPDLAASCAPTEPQQPLPDLRLCAQEDPAQQPGRLP